MRYLSTRGHPERRRFCEILLEGLAPDGGLYLPESYPQVDGATLDAWRKVLREQGYAALAFEVLSLYIDDIPADDLRALCSKTYTEQVFGTREIVPVRQLEALEADRLDLLPDLTFARALTSSVCRQLRIDPAPILEALPRPTPRLGSGPEPLNETFSAPGGGGVGSWRENWLAPRSLWPWCSCWVP